MNEPAGADADVDEGPERHHVRHDAADRALPGHERVDRGRGAAPEDGAEAVALLPNVVLQRLGKGLENLFYDHRELELFYQKCQGNDLLDLRQGQ